MTRITENMIYGNMLQGINQAQAQLLTRSQQATSGHLLSRASDDPSRANRVMSLGTAVARLAAMDNVSARASTELSVSEVALNQANDIFASARDIAVKASSAGFSASDRQTMADEVEGLRQSLVATANSRAGDTYVFGGFKTRTAPFLADGTFVGDANARMVEVAPGTQVAMSGSGAAAFTAAGGQDLFALLATLRDDLRANNVAAIGAAFANLDAAQTQIQSAEQQVGISEHQVNAANSLRASLTTSFKNSLDASANVDPSAAAIGLQQAQQALETAVDASAKVMTALQESLKL